MRINSREFIGDPSAAARFGAGYADHAAMG